MRLHSSTGKRITGLAIMQVLGIFLLCLPLAHLQLFQNCTYETLALNNRLMVQVATPVRGEIFDRNGVPLVTNHPIYTLVGTFLKG